MIYRSIFMLAMMIASLRINGQQPPDSAVVEADTTVHSYAEQMPEFPGGQGLLMKFLQLNMFYPDDARAAGAEGKVIAQFIVNEDGSISDIHIIRNVFPSCDSEVIAMLNQMPRWNPGSQNGVPVKVYFVLPVTFKLNEEDYMKANITLPSFPAGDDSLSSFINRNTQYPKAAKKSHATGTVVLSFEVDSIGHTQNIKVYKSVDSGCDEEATRVLKLITQWVPGTRDGREVTMPYYIEVPFNPEIK